MIDAPRVRSWASRVAVGTLTIGLLLTRPSAAELIVMVDGGTLKVRQYRVDGDHVELDLPSGGVLTLPLLRIDRILADEIEPQPTGLPGGADIRVDYSPSHEVPRTPYGAEIFAAARRHAINPGLVAAMVRVESAFDPWAVSTKGAAGLMQLMPSTAERFGLELDWVFDPERNLDAGARYLRWLIDRFEGDLGLVLAGYNAGEATVDRYGGIPPYRETREYIRRVYSAAGTAGSGPEAE